MLKDSTLKICLDIFFKIYNFANKVVNRLNRPDNVVRWAGGFALAIHVLTFEYNII